MTLHQNTIKESMTYFSKHSPLMLPALRPTERCSVLIWVDNMHYFNKVAFLKFSNNGDGSSKLLMDHKSKDSHHSSMAVVELDDTLGKLGLLIKAIWSQEFCYGSTNSPSLVTSFSCSCSGRCTSCICSTYIECRFVLYRSIALLIHYDDDYDNDDNDDDEKKNENEKKDTKETKERNWVGMWMQMLMLRPSRLSKWTLWKFEMVVVVVLVLVFVFVENMSFEPFLLLEKFFFNFSCFHAIGYWHVSHNFSLWNIRAT